jgi:hypothetical protein
MNLEQDWIKGKFAGSVGKHRNKFFVRFSGEYKEYKSFYTAPRNQIIQITHNL